MISQPIIDGNQNIVGAILLQFDAFSMVKSIVDANVNKIDFIYQQLVVFDTKSPIPPYLPDGSPSYRIIYETESAETQTNGLIIDIRNISARLAAG